MGRKEIMKWNVQQGRENWFDLVMENKVTFGEFVQDILSRKDNTGNIYVRLLVPSYHNVKNAKDMSMVYDYGVITWISDKFLNQIDKYVVKQARANGFPTNINYHLIVEQN